MIMDASAWWPFHNTINDTIFLLKIDKEALAECYNNEPVTVYVHTICRWKFRVEFLYIDYRPNQSSLIFT